MPKSFLAYDLGGFFRCRFLRRLLLVFGRLQTLKIELPLQREHHFYKIDVFKNGWKILDLGGILGSQIDPKSIKTCIQKHAFF